MVKLAKVSALKTLSMCSVFFAVSVTQSSKLIVSQSKANRESQKWSSTIKKEIFNSDKVVRPSWLINCALSTSTSCRQSPSKSTLELRSLRKALLKKRSQIDLNYPKRLLSMLRSAELSLTQPAWMLLITCWRKISLWLRKNAILPRRESKRKSMTRRLRSHQELITITKWQRKV